MEERSNPVVRTILRPVETYFEEQFRPTADGNTIICSTLYKKAIALGINPDRLLQIPNGCDTVSIYPGNLFESRKRLFLPTQGTIIGYVGTAFVNDARFIADALLKTRKILPDLQFVWFGARPKEARQVLEGFPNTHLVKNIHDKQLNDYFASCNLFWLPLRNTPANWGRWPLKLMII